MLGARTKTSWLSVLALLCLCLVGGASARVTASAPVSGGVTIAPATLTIALAPHETEHSTSFAVTNHYSVPVTLHFAAAASATNIKSPLDASKQLSLAHGDLTLAAAQTVQQTVTLTDNKKLAPGSQVAMITVSQEVVPGSQVGIAASINVPVVTVKEAGAVSSLGRGTLSTSHLAWGLPKTVTGSVHNTGNMIAIPHGYVTIQAPNGRLVASGPVNVASAAVSPGASLALSAPINTVARALWPGMYKMTFSYGLGHGQTAQTVSARILYLTWWHVVALVVVLSILYYGVRIIILLLLGKSPGELRLIRLAKKIRLVGKGVT